MSEKFEKNLVNKISKAFSGQIKDSVAELEKKNRAKAEQLEKEKQARIKKFRTEASRLASLANKRLKRLEKAGLKDSPAYKKWIDEGGQKFGIKGKDYRQVQSEMARMRNFINSETSTVRGVNNVLKSMAKNTGIKYKNLKELQKQAGQFFQLAGRIEQYLRTVEDMASAIGYQKIWEAINKYVQQEKIDLTNSENNVEEMTHKVLEAMGVYGEEETYEIKSKGITATMWFSLDDDD